jgi:hypothetical protein
LRYLFAGVTQPSVDVPIQIREPDIAIAIMVYGGIEQAINDVLGEVAGAVVDGCIVGELRSPAAAENISPWPGDGVPEITAAKRPG